MPRKKQELAVSPPRTRKAKIQAFLAAYAETCRVTLASKAAGIGIRTHYFWLERDPEYAKAFDETRCLAADYVEAECIRRAVDGWTEDVHYQGQKCGEVRRYSDGLMMLLLKGLKPDVYGIQRTEVTGAMGTPMQARIEVVFVRPGEVNS